MELAVFKYELDTQFQLYVLGSPKVKQLQREFEFYNLRFYREEKAKVPTMSLRYPKANVYWYLEFKKYIEAEISSKDLGYANSWKLFLERLKNKVFLEYKNLKEQLSKITQTKVLNNLFNYSLRDYQAFDLEVLFKKLEYSSPHVGLILSEQRTGKTRIALAVSHKVLIKDSVLLIICPKSAVAGWEKEIQFLNDYLKTNPFMGDIVKNTNSIKTLDDNYDENRINYRIITYDLLKRLTKTQVKTLVSYKKFNSIAVIGDECHRLRNFETYQSEALFNLKDVLSKKKDDSLYFIGITGTPAIRDTSDVFGILSFINFSKIQFKPTHEAFAQFKEYFYICEDTSFGKQIKALKRKAELNYIIQAVSIQTKQKDLDLFKNYTKKYLKVTLQMDSEQKEIYNSIDTTFEYEDEVDCKNPMIKYLRLQQVCNDPNVIVNAYTEIPPKFRYIVAFAKKNTSQFIVMSKKLKALKNLALLLEKYGITYSALDGTMSLKVRDNEIEDFKSGKSQIFIIQSDVGKEALTLPEASYTIFLDRDFAQGNNEQAEARMTPIDGGTCTKYILDLIMKDTIEEEIYEKLIIKKEDIKNVNEIYRKGEEVNGN